MGMKMITKIDRMIIEMIYKLYLYVLLFGLLVIQVLIQVDMIRVKVLMEVR
jgi:hypothetical protein